MTCALANSIAAIVNAKPRQDRHQRRTDHPQQTVVGRIGDEPRGQHRDDRRRQRRQHRVQRRERPAQHDDDADHRAEKHVAPQRRPRRVDHHAEAERRDGVADHGGDGPEPRRHGARGGGLPGRVGRSDGADLGELGDRVDPAREVQLRRRLDDRLDLVGDGADLHDERGRQHDNAHRVAGVLLGDREQPRRDQLRRAVRIRSARSPARAASRRSPRRRGPAPRPTPPGSPCGSTAKAVRSAGLVVAHTRDCGLREGAMGSHPARRRGCQMPHLREGRPQSDVARQPGDRRHLAPGAPPPLDVPEECPPPRNPSSSPRRHGH